MTDQPSSPSPAVDPITAILLSVTRIEGNLAGALDTLKRHDGELAEVRAEHRKDFAEVKDTQIDHGNRLTALETKQEAEEGHTQRRISDRAVFWGMVSALAVVAAAIIAIMTVH